jgi:hypothetical protein
MDHVDREFGEPNPNAPAALSRFAFLIGIWRCEAKVMLADRKWQNFNAVWIGRYILDGYAIADEYRMTGSAGEPIVLGMNFRAYDALGHFSFSYIPLRHSLNHAWALAGEI